MQFLTPVVLTDATLTSSTIAEPDATMGEVVWAAATAYTVGQQVIRTQTHSVYRRLVAGTTATTPETDPVNWVRIGPTNKWAAFDQAVGTKSQRATSLQFVLTPGVLIDGLALLDVVATSVTVTVVNAAVTVYSRTQTLLINNGTTWYDWLFGEITVQDTVLLIDLLPYIGGVITITLNGTGTVSVGTVAVGRVTDLGGTQYGARVGILDYSVKTTDAFGTTSVTQRNYAKRSSQVVRVESGFVDEAARRLAAIRAVPVVWIGADSYSSTVIYGFFKDWEIAIAYPTVSDCSLTIEGLT